MQAEPEKTDMGKCFDADMDIIPFGNVITASCTPKEDKVNNKSG